MEIKEIIRRCKTKLQSHYGSIFRGLILYGSAARGKYDESSDIDLIVLLSKHFNYFSELKKIINLLYSIQLESIRLISAKPVMLSEFELGNIQFYRNAKREGIFM